MRNQILSVDINAKNQKRSSGEKADIKKIIIVFVIIMIIFSIGCIGIGAYAIFDNNVISFKKPQIAAEKEEDKLLITVTSTKPIDRVEYEWNNDGNTQKINGNNQIELEKTINLPIGNNSIVIRAYDVSGKMKKFENTYQVESTAPQLKIESLNGKIKITAKDNEKMAYITYRWDDGEETRIEAEEDSSAQMEQSIESPSGIHTLTVEAVNTRNLSTTKTQEVKGVRRPVVAVIQDADDPKYVIVTVTDEEAVKRVIFDINGNKSQVNLSDYHESFIQYRVELQPGHNLVTVTAYNFDDAETVFPGQCEYNP